MNKLVIKIVAILTLLSGTFVYGQTAAILWSKQHNTSTDSPTVTSVEFLPDGRILSAGYNGIVKLWDTNGNSTVIYQSGYINGSPIAINSISSDGNKIAIGQDNGLIKIINGTDFNVNCRVLKVCVNNDNVAAVGATNIVYVNGVDYFHTGNGSHNYAVTLGNNEIAFGGTESVIYSSWQYPIFVNDWLLEVDYKNNTLVGVGVSQYLFVNNSIIYAFPDKGNSSVSINPINNKIIVANWKPAIYLLTTNGIAEKIFTESALIRCIKWNPNGSTFVYGTADGRIVYALPQYSNTNTVYSPVISTKSKGKK